VKKFFYISFIIIYSLTTIGITLNAHFCGGKVKNITLYSQANQDKDCCDTTTNCKTTCCSDRTIIIKIIDHPTETPKFKFNSFEKTFSVIAHLNISSQAPAEIFSKAIPKSLYTTSRVFLLDCSFRI